MYGLFVSEEVRGVPDKLIKLKASKHYLKATELLMNSGEIYIYICNIVTATLILLEHITLL